MRLSIIGLAGAMLGIILWLRAAPYSTPNNLSAAVAPARARSGGLNMAGTVLVAPHQALRTPVGGRVVRRYFTDGQTVPAGAPLLKLAVGRGTAARTAFASAPEAGDLSRAPVGPGDYLAAGTPYARLTPRGPVRVQVARADAARLQPGDSLRVLVGPVGLAGVLTPVTAVLPGPAGETRVLVLGHLGWPPGTTVQVVLAPTVSR
jgi:multidrug efflux pump subunit AcrA (membrane-fusion protein)